MAELFISLGFGHFEGLFAGFMAGASLKIAGSAAAKLELAINSK